MRRLSALLAVFALAVFATGCGDSDVSAGASVAIYASAPQRGSEAAAGRQLCAGAKRALAAAGGMAGEVRVRLTCLDASGPAGDWTLARVGANARRAVEDSTTAAYIGEVDPRARAQSAPIVEAAGIAEVTATSGEMAMRKVLNAISNADSDESPRQAVFEAFSDSTT